MGYFFTYLLLYERLLRTFEQTTYRLTSLHSVCFAVLVTGYLLSQQSNSVCWMLFVLDHFESWDQFNTLYHQLLWTRLVVDAVLNMFIVVLFCRRILNLTKRRSSQCSAVHKGATPSFGNQHSEKIYGVMIKYFVLTTWTVLSTQLFTATQLVLSDSIQHAVHHGHFAYYYTAYALYYVAGNVDAVVSTAFVVLSYSFSDRVYNRFCGCAHATCLWVWGNARSRHIGFGSKSMSPQSGTLKRDGTPTPMRSLAVLPTKTVSLVPTMSVSVADSVVTQSGSAGADTAANVE